MMTNRSIVQLASCIFILLQALACRKASQPLITNELVGKWTWVNSNNDLYVVLNQNSGIRRTITFTEDGACLLSHNDPTTDFSLMVAQSDKSLPISVTDTEPYQVLSIASPCSGIKSPTLVIGDKEGYSFSISHDTLSLSLGSCLSPYYTIYIKTN